MLYSRVIKTHCSSGWHQSDDQPIIKVSPSFNLIINWISPGRAIPIIIGGIVVAHRIGINSALIIRRWPIPIIKIRLGNVSIRWIRCRVVIVCII